MKLRELEGKRILVWGLGHEGRAVIENLVNSINATWLVYSDAPLTPSEIEFLNQYPAVNHDAQFSIERILQSTDIIIKSPGVCLYKPEIQSAIARGVLVTSGTNIWFAERSEENTIVITGTKGKSTSSSILHHLLCAQGFNTILAGNIGVPLIQHLTTTGVEYWVIELSSYQLADFTGFVDRALIVNLFSEHLNWHGTQQQYEDDKLKLCKQIKADGKIITSTALKDKVTQRTTLPVLLYDSVDAPCTIQNSMLYVQGTPRRLSPERFPGNHSLGNVSAVLATLATLGISPNKCFEALATFTPLPHRLTSVATINGVLFIDDSISTIPESSIAALRSLEPQPCILILGGFDRGISWENSARVIIASNPKAVICTGQNGQRIFAALQQHAISISQADTLYYIAEFDDAVQKAAALASSGDAVVLSPGAPSYDSFKDYTQRGEHFRKLINGLNLNQSS